MREVNPQLNFQIFFFIYIQAITFVLMHQFDPFSIIEPSNSKYSSEIWFLSMDHYFKQTDRRTRLDLLKIFQESRISQVSVEYLTLLTYGMTNPIYPHPLF